MRRWGGRGVGILWKRVEGCDGIGGMRGVLECSRGGWEVIWEVEVDEFGWLMSAIGL